MIDFEKEINIVEKRIVKYIHQELKKLVKKLGDEWLWQIILSHYSSF